DHTARLERTAAAAAYLEATSYRPLDADPYLRLSRLYLDWGRTDEALAALDEAEALDAAPEDIARLRLSASIALTDWTAVAEHAAAVLALAPQDAAARHALARAYVWLERWDAAQAEYEALLSTDPDDQLAHQGLGTLLAGLDPAATGHLAAAGTPLTYSLLNALATAAAEGDDPAYASALIGRALFEQAEWSLAARGVRRALSHSPDYADAHAYLGHSLDQLGRAAEAEDHLLQATSLAPSSAVARIFLGLHYDGLGDTAAARGEYEAAYDLDPTNPATCVAIGMTWAVEGRYIAAEIWLEEAVALRPDDPVLWETLARFYLERNIGAAGRAREVAAKLVDLAPASATAHHLLGWAAFLEGDHESAEASLLVALSLDPQLAWVYYHLGLLRSVQGDTVQVGQAFQRAVDLDASGEILLLIEQRQ
ncbi:MAG: tetratricopeptide repeat protein, partial [Anaerolineales bacterium]